MCQHNTQRLPQLKSQNGKLSAILSILKYLDHLPRAGTFLSQGLTHVSICRVLLDIQGTERDIQSPGAGACCCILIRFVSFLFEEYKKLAPELSISEQSGSVLTYNMYVITSQSME